MRPDHRTCRDTFTFFLSASFLPYCPSLILCSLTSSSHYLSLSASQLCDDGETRASRSSQVLDTGISFRSFTSSSFIISYLSFFSFVRVLLLLLLPWSSYHFHFGSHHGLPVLSSPHLGTYRLTPVWCTQTWLYHLQSHENLEKDVDLYSLQQWPPTVSTFFRVHCSLCLKTSFKY